MSKRLCLATSCFFIALLCAASTPPELFQKAKEQFRQASYTDALKTLDELAQVSTQPENEKYRAALTPALAFYRGACLAALGRKDEARAEFQKYLTFQSGAQVDPNMYPASVVAAFEDARLAMQATAGDVQHGSMADEYHAFREEQPQIEADMAEEGTLAPVRSVMNNEERRTFDQLTTPASRREFLAKFWASRSGFQKEFNRRVAFADMHFSQDGMRGSLTDRGVVFILLGPPSYIGGQPIRSGEDASDPAGMSRYSAQEVRAAQIGSGSSQAAKAQADKMMGPANESPVDVSKRWRQVWHYRKELLPKTVRYQELNLEFITRDGYGNNVLQRDSVSLTALDAARRAIVDGSSH